MAGIGKSMQIFRRLDINGDGTMSLQEFADCLREVDPGFWHDHRLDGLFSALDVNRDGHISYDELEQWLEHGHIFGCLKKVHKRAANKLNEHLSADPVGLGAHDVPAEPVSTGPERTSDSKAMPASHRDSLMTPKLFITHLGKLEDHASSRNVPCGKTMIEIFSRSLYSILNSKGKVKFEVQVCKSRNFYSLSRILKPLLVSRPQIEQQACMEELCPAVRAAHAIRERFKELPKTEDTFVSTAEDMFANDLCGNAELLHSRLQFDAQKLLWNMFLGNRAFLEDRDNSLWHAWGDGDKFVTLVVWICFLNLLFDDKSSESYRYFHSEDAFAQYVSPEKFRLKWLRFKEADQEHCGVLVYRLNIKVLRMLMQQGLSLDMAVLKCLQEFSKQLQEMPRRVECFAHFYYGKAYADLIETLKRRKEENAQLIKSLNCSPMPPRIVLAAGIFMGGFLLNQLSYMQGSSTITLENEDYAKELRSLENCSAANLRVLAAVRSQSRQHHKFNRTMLLNRIMHEFDKNEVEAQQDLVALLWYVREGVPLQIHRPFTSLVPMMLTLDWYQSGHEASSFDPSRSVPRDEWEMKISAGLYKENITTMEEKKERPKYGALNVVQDVLGINGGIFYGATYITLKNVRMLSTISFTDTSSDAVHGITGDDDVCSMFDGSECDLGTLDYAAGVICGGWSKTFLKVAIERAHEYLGAVSTEKKSRRILMEDHGDFMDIPSLGDGYSRQYDEVQIHGQILFDENVESVALCKPFIPDKVRGKIVRIDGKLLIVNPVPDFEYNYDVSPSKRRAAGEEIVTEPEYESDDYYLFFERLALMDDFKGSTPAFDDQVRRWSHEKTEQFRRYVLNQQTQLLAMGALVHVDIPDYGSRCCFHLKRCLDCIREKYPSIEIRRIVTNPDTFDFEFESRC